MDGKTKDDIQELVSRVEEALRDAFKAGKMTELEYRTADAERADLYITLDCIETISKTDRIHALENVRDAIRDAGAELGVMTVIENEIMEETKRQCERLE